ncbi:MAG: purine-nucleoside phosphorylase [Planctomycetota bacterium]
MSAGRETADGFGGRPGPEACAAAERILAAGGARAAVGVVLGTGLGGLADRLEDVWSIDSRSTGWLVASTATGHAGRLVCGRLAGVPLVMLQGRVHAYEGFAGEALTRGVELLAALGVQTILLTNASGGLRPDMQSGELVVMSDHLDFVGRSWSRPLVDRPPGGRMSAAADEACYDAGLIREALAATRRAGVPARAGVYAYLLGPSYETRAEYRMLRRFGADAVGMSTVPEAVAARRLGLTVAAVSVVTNVARPDAPDQTDAEEVCRLAGAAAEGVWAIVESLVNRAPAGGIA